MLDVAADQWGQAVLRAPSKLPPDVAAAAVLSLASHHANLVREGLEQMPERGMEDVGFAQAMRETRATEVLIATLGTCLNEGPKGDTAAAWGLLWKARQSAPQAAEALRQYGRHAKADPVPRSRKRLQGASLADLAKLASSVPPFLAARKPAAAKPVAKPAAGAGSAGARPAAGNPAAQRPPAGKPAAGKQAPARPGRPPAGPRVPGGSGPGTPPSGRTRPTGGEAR
jgi:hypothetical protein